MQLEHNMLLGKPWHGMQQLLGWQMTVGHGLTYQLLLLQGAASHLSFSCLATSDHVRPVYPPPCRQNTTAPVEPALYTLKDPLQVTNSPYQDNW